MERKRNAIFWPVACLLVSLIAIGCNETGTTDTAVSDASTQLAATSTTEGCAGCCAEANQETVICAKCGQEKPAGGNAEACKDCPGGQCAEATESTAQGKPAGCCGKCAEELAASQKASVASGTCKECADGDSANCKCATEGTDAKPVEGAATEDTDADSAFSPPGQTSDLAQDRDVFHFLLSNKDKITRTVTELADGVETVTESSDPAIVAKIQEHVAAMYRRVENNQPIRMRDPLFREVFNHADKIKMELANTTGGICVKETSDDEYVVKLIREHAKVVSGFVEYGFEEARKNHASPHQ
jgi:hypothetical protein